jgi:hypothetical protein
MSKTDWERLKNMKDEDIDYSDILLARVCNACGMRSFTPAGVRSICGVPGGV